MNLREQLRAAIQAAPTGENAELLNRCYVALGEQAENGPTFMGEPVISDIGEVSRDAMKRLFRALNCSGTVTHTDLVIMACEKLGEQGVPAGCVTMPGRLNLDGPDDQFAKGWNAHHDEVAQRVASPKAVCPDCFDITGCTRCAPKAEPAQEPVGEMKLSELVDGLVIPVVPADLPIGTKLYASPAPAQPTVAMPDGLSPDGMYGKNHAYADGWNDCLDEVKRLNRSKA